MNQWNTQYLIFQISYVVEEFKEREQLDFYTEFNEMLSSGTCTFPTDFFLDTVLGCCVMV